jgi:alkylhydroperoxidase family enzyme
MTTIDEAQQQAIDAVARPGDWLTGAQRIDVWRQVRDAGTNALDQARRDALSPNAITGAHEATDHLPAATVEVAHRVASDPGRLTRAWAEAQIAALGEETYTEVVGVVAIASTIDRFHSAIDEPLPTLPQPAPGDPNRARPDDVGDVGAWVSQSTGPTRANVSRTLSLVPVTNATWRNLVDSHYSRGAEFLDDVWNRTLPRPAVELIAARATSLNECFY